MAGKPNYRVVAKSKTSGKYQDIAAFWIGERGISGQLDKAVAKIVLTNGAVIKPDGCYFNLQENKEADSTESRATAPQHEEGGEQGDDIPF
jgi:hypothetical protein